MIFSKSDIIAGSEPAFQICEILTQVRILGSLLWITDLDPDPDPALFFSGFKDANRK
jgi:hypothetical protein